MSLFRKSTEPPLHEAVLNEQYDQIRKLSEESNQLNELNHQGLTALEIATLLNKEKCVAILDSASEKTIIKVVPRGNVNLVEFNKKQFQEWFGVRYLANLHFDSYEQLKEVIRNCPLILKSPLGKENQALGERYRSQITSGYIADVTIQWINEEIGYGAFAARDFPAQEYIGEYTGFIRRLYRLHPNHNAYCFQYPTRWWSLKYFIIDSLKEGNQCRFINHADDPNLQPECVVLHGLLHQVFVTNQPIPKGTELTFDYGPDYWQKRKAI